MNKVPPKDVVKPDLRPVPGRRLPAELRRENVARLGEALAGGVRDPEFEALVHRIDTGPLHLGNEVEIFFDGDKAFASVAEVIESATREILLETYILKDDAVGYALIE